MNVVKNNELNLQAAKGASAMHTFQELSQLFESQFAVRHFPVAPASLYEPAQYILQLGGKRIRPVLCLMANELVNSIDPDAYPAANAIELFHNFTLIHDDIMDKAPLRRGLETVHQKFGESTALLAGDVMLVAAYEFLTQLDVRHLKKVIKLFNQTARQVCEGQQIDMDLSALETGDKDVNVNFDEYVKMIELKTSVLLAASLQMGAIIGGAGVGNQKSLYQFGKYLGLAFQVQDDYLDAFGEPEKFGKIKGGDILANKKTFLLIHAFEVAGKGQLDQMQDVLMGSESNKVDTILRIYKECNVDAWAEELKTKYYQKALEHLEEVAIVSSRKKPLADLAAYLMKRDY